MTFKTHQTDPNGYTVSHATNENDVLLLVCLPHSCQVAGSLILISHLFHHTGATTRNMFLDGPWISKSEVVNEFHEPAMKCLGQRWNFVGIYRGIMR